MWRVSKRNNEFLYKQFVDLLMEEPERQIQHNPQMLKDDNHCYVAMEKINGIRGTWALIRHKRLLLKDRFGYCICGDGDDYVLQQISDQYHIRDNLSNMIGQHDFIIMRGQCIGPDIMNNEYIKESTEMYVDEIIFPEKHVNPVCARKISEFYGFKFAPILDSCLGLPETVDQMFAYAKGESMIAPIQRKGVIVRDTERLKSFECITR